MSRLNTRSAERRACRLVQLSRTAARYTPVERDDTPVEQALKALAGRHPRYGFRKLFRLLRAEGHRWNHKRVWRVYCQMKLNLRRRFKKRYRRAAPLSLVQPTRPNQGWSMDFVRNRSGNPVLIAAT